MQEDLIGAEQEGRHDEKRRAALHAAWLEQQDNAQVEQLLHGVKNGLRRRRNALDDEVNSSHGCGPVRPPGLCWDKGVIMPLISTSRGGDIILSLLISLHAYS